MSTPLVPTAPGDTAPVPAGAGLRRLIVAWRWPLLAALVCLLAHLPFLAPTLDDIDAVNFAFGVRSFDPAQHHPHPPGYPVYVALGKLSTGVLHALQPAGASSPIERDPAALALAFWSALFGALGVLAWCALFIELDALGKARDGVRGPPERSVAPAATWAAVLAAAAPLAWFSAARPMSDVPGLVIATIAQAMLLAAWRHESRPSEGAGGTNGWLLAGAGVAGLAVGVRSQALWLTLPFLAAVLVARARRVKPTAGLSGLGAYGLGIVVWALPMIAVTGWQRYLGALGSQGAEDFAGVDMLWTHPGARRLAVGLVQTFVLPWSIAPLAIVVLALALAGAWRLRRVPITLAILGLLIVPYAIFHLLFQETVTTRYALPLVPAVCYLAVHGARALRRPLSDVLLAAVAVASLALVVPALWSYARVPAPIFQALRDMEAQAAGSANAHWLGMHRRISTESRVVLQWAARAPWAERLPSPRHSEWAVARAALVDRPASAVWFLAEPARAGELRYRDLALIDPSSRRLVHEYRWGHGLRGLVDGVRPDTMDLYEIDAPGWIAGEGWALTPETAGLAARARLGPSYRPIEALVRRRPGETVLVLGGRHLGTAADGPARVQARIDGTAVADFVVPVDPQFFARMVTIPAGRLAGNDAFATLDVRAAAADGSARVVPVSIEQFDIQDATSIASVFETGWLESEYDPSRQMMWRWMSDRATLWVHPGSAETLDVRITAESPRRYFERPVTLRVRVGERELARVTPEARWPRLLARALGGSRVSVAVTVDRESLARASNRVTLEADQYFVPAAAGATGDRRRLSARILDVSVTAHR